MQFGPFANRLAALVVVITVCGGRLDAQTRVDSGYQPPQLSGANRAGTANSGAVQALFLSPTAVGRQTPYVDAYGNPVILPAGYACAGPNACPGPYPAPMGTYPAYSEDMMDVVGMPGITSEQCGPHYFDVRAESVYMVRDATFGDEVIFTQLVPQDGEGEPLPPVIGLTSNQLEYDHEPGFRLIGRYDLGPLSVVEFGYFGIFNWATSASVVDPEGPDNSGDGDLFSLFSRPASAGPTDFEEYGTTPASVATAGGPMGQTDRSLRHSVFMESNLQTAEMSYRRYWVGFSPAISGTILAGFRFTHLGEEFHFNTSGLDDVGDVESADYMVRVRNNLSGFQTGGDVWLHVIQGLRVGTEGKVGIYNNRLRVLSTIDSTPAIVPPSPGTFPQVPEAFGKNQVAFITEASADVVADVLPSWSLRAGYEVMFVNSIALSGENFNTVSPYGLQGQETRVPFLADQGHAFYHGFHAGLEYIW